MFGMKEHAVLTILNWETCSNEYVLVVIHVDVVFERGVVVIGVDRYALFAAQAETMHWQIKLLADLPFQLYHGLAIRDPDMFLYPVRQQLHDHRCHLSFRVLRGVRFGDSLEPVKEGHYETHHLVHQTQVVIRMALLHQLQRPHCELLLHCSFQLARLAVQVKMDGR